MKRFLECPSIVAVCLLIALVSGLAAQKPDGSADKTLSKSDHLVTFDSVAGIKIGMTIDDVKNLMPNAKFSRESGEGADEIEVKIDGNTVMWLTAAAGDEDYDSPVDGKTEILRISVTGKNYKTATGIGISTSIEDAVKQYGKVRTIIEEGLTGNEYVVFTYHPRGIDFGVTNPRSSQKTFLKVGRYNGGSIESRIYEPGSYISSIDIPASWSKYVEEQTITADSIGDIRMGMTVADAEKLLDLYEFKRSSDGEGIALIDVVGGMGPIMTFYAGESDPEKPIGVTGKIEFIEVWSSEYKTVEGVHAEMTLSEAARIYGGVKLIRRSEIESREFVEFNNHPRGISFRLTAEDRTAGIYEPGKSETKSFRENAKIFSIRISAPPVG